MIPGHVGVVRLSQVTGGQVDGVTGSQSNNRTQVWASNNIAKKYILTEFLSNLRIIESSLMKGKVEHKVP